MIAEGLVVAEHGIHFQIRTLLPHAVSLSFFQNTVTSIVVIRIVLCRARVGKLFLLVRTLRISHPGFQTEMVIDKPIEIKVIRPRRINRLILMIQSRFIKRIQITGCCRHMSVIRLYQITIIIMYSFIRIG